LVLELGLATAFVGAALTASAGGRSEFSSPEARVVVDEAKRSVVVSVERDRARIPRAVGFRIFHADGGTVDVQLQAIDPRDDRHGVPARFSGTFSPYAGSFVGFELKIPLDSTRTSVIRSEQMKRER
jgi:hypothetical protein